MPWSLKGVMYQVFDNQHPSTNDIDSPPGDFEVCLTCSNLRTCSTFCRVLCSVVVAATFITVRYHIAHNMMKGAYTCVAWFEPINHRLFILLWIKILQILSLVWHSLFFHILGKVRYAKVLKCCFEIVTFIYILNQIWTENLTFSYLLIYNETYLVDWCL